MPRPCDASTRSLSRGWITRSLKGSVGMLFFNSIQFVPPLRVKNSPISVAANNRCGFLTSSRMVRTTRPAGMSPAIEMKVFPPSDDL